MQELTKVDFSSLAGYYGGRDDLAGYTIETELRRMRYSVVTERGDRVGNGEGGGGEEDGSSKSSVRDFLSERKGHAMMRMANQSIFADMLEASAVPLGRKLETDAHAWYYWSDNWAARATRIATWYIFRTQNTFYRGSRRKEMIS